MKEQEALSHKLEHKEIRIITRVPITHCNIEGQRKGTIIQKKCLQIT